MNTMRLPWPELAVLLPALGSIWVRFRRDPSIARRDALTIGVLTLLAALGAWADFRAYGPRGSASGLLTVDDLNAPLLPLGALLYLMTVLATLRTKYLEFSIARTLASESMLLAIFAASTSWGVVAMMALSVVPRAFELLGERRAGRVYLIHMGVFIALMVAGEAGVSREAGPSGQPLWAILCLTLAMLVRGGAVPLHCWMTDLFEHATFGTALLFVTPLTAAFGVARLVLPIAPAWDLRIISTMSLFTAIYASGMALVQRDARRFFCYLFLSGSSLVLVGMETATPIGLTGSLSLWLSASLSLAAFGLVLRCVEARVGRIGLTGFLGLYEQVPTLAGLFLLTGLASVGFPGTAGFFGLEMIVQAAVESMPAVGPLVAIVSALNGLAVTHAYFRIFAGRAEPSSIDLRIRPAERVAVLVTTALVIGGGLFPQPGIEGRHEAARRLLAARGGEGPSRDGAGPGERSGPPASHPRSAGLK